MNQILSLRVKTTKLLEENIGVNLHDFGFDYSFFGLKPNIQATKEK
jgi:hypothetical protein